jgi:hypothetical protein
LLVYNDACFTENDFQSIQRIGDSLKKTDEQKSKIGRFGIGFNSVYHLTDLPSFVSSSFLVMLDPQVISSLLALADIPHVGKIFTRCESIEPRKDGQLCHKP